MNKKKTCHGKHWHERHVNDPFVKKAQKFNRCSRSSFKIDEIQEKFNLFKKNQRILDCGAAPGGWSERLSFFTQEQKENHRQKNAEQKTTNHDHHLMSQNHLHSPQTIDDQSAYLKNSKNRDKIKYHSHERNHHNNLNLENLHQNQNNLMNHDFQNNHPTLQNQIFEKNFEQDDTTNTKFIHSADFCHGMEQQNSSREKTQKTKESFCLDPEKNDTALLQKNQSQISHLGGSAVENILAIDLLPMKKMNGVCSWVRDLNDPLLIDDIMTFSAQNGFDHIVSDAMSNVTGNRSLDEANWQEIFDSIKTIAQKILKKNGSLVVKLWRAHGDLKKLVSPLEFQNLCLFKPKSSRKESSEIYLIAQKLKK